MHAHDEDHDHHDHHDHHHDHADAHAPPRDQEDEAGHYQIMGTALCELLIEKGLFSPADLRMEIERMDARSPARGAEVVARAWTDPGFKQRLLADGSAACRELGFEIGALHLIAVENAPDVHNVIVCTLCSCYPRNLLGLPPDWYKSRAYRSRVVRDPRAVLREFGTDLPDHVSLRVHDSTADMRYIVLPMRPEGSEGLDEAQLAALVTRDCMIGVALPRPPASV